MEEHVPEHELSRFAIDPASLGPARCAEIERHAETCAKCSASIGFFSVTDEELADADVWEPLVGSESGTALSEYFSRVAAEDEEAERLLSDFLKQPGKVAWTDVRARQELHTGGVARRLNAEAHEICGNRPLVALTLAETAATIAEMLPDDVYPYNAIHEVRGTAWKEKANAFVRLGEVAQAMDALTRAERAYRKLKSSGFGLASVALVRAAALYQQQLLTEAEHEAEKAERGFAHLGQERSRMKAVQLRGCIRYELGDFDTAATIFSA